MSQISKFLIYTTAGPRYIKSKQIFAISDVKVKFDVYRSLFSERCNAHYRQCHSHSKRVHHKDGEKHI
jgi:hypothetical protein